MEYLAYGFAAFLVLSGLGLGFTLFLLPGELRRYSLLVAPWVGYCYGVLAFWEAYIFGGRASPLVAQLILIPPVLCLIAFLVMRGLKATWVAIFGDPKTGAALGLGVAVFIFISVPALRYNHGLTTVSLFDDDVAYYAAVSRFLMDFTRTSSVGFVGQGMQWFNEYPVEWAFGPVSVAAFLGTYLGIMPDQDTTLCVNLLGALGAVGVYLFLHDSLKVKTWIAVLGIVLYGFHPAFHYLVLQGFFAQVVAMGLIVLIIWAQMGLIEARGRADIIRWLLLLACFHSGLLLSYEHMAPFLWVFGGAYCLFLAAARRQLRPIWISALGYLVALAIFALVCPPRAAAFLTFFKIIAGVQAGWYLPLFTPDYLAGVSYQNSPFTVENGPLHLVLAAIVSLVAIVWIVIALKTAGKKTLAFWVACIVVYAGALVLGLRGEDGQIGGYKSFKFATFFLPFFVAALALLFNLAPKEWPRRLILGLKIMTLLGLSAGYIRADSRLLKAMRISGKWVQPEYRDLLGIDQNKNVDAVNIMGPDGWKIGWASYFLIHKKLYFEYPSYWAQSPLEASYDLQDAKSDAPIRHLPDARVPHIERVNDRFYLVGPIQEK